MVDQKWLKAAGIRAIRTVCQTAGGLLATAMFMEDVNWQAVISASLLAGILSLVTSLGGLPELKEE